MFCRKIELLGAGEQLDGFIELGPVHETVLVLVQLPEVLACLLLLRLGQDRLLGHGKTGLETLLDGQSLHVFTLLGAEEVFDFCKK